MSSAVDEQEHAFRLTKWYMDCVDPTGLAFIGYWASLSWRSACFTWHSAVLYEVDGTRQERTSLKAVPAPERRDGVITWDAPELGCRLVARPGTPAIGIRLLQTDHGSVEWECAAPSAGMSIALSKRQGVSGTGYVEKLVLSIAPWRLPFDELRWGRWVSEDAFHSMAWIEWRGELSRTWVFLNGNRILEAGIGDAGVAVADRTLALNEGRELESRAIGEIVKAIPVVNKILPDSLLAWRETKWCSSGVMRGAGGDPIRGWAIHEKVRLR
jgi:hypothetical protein